MDTADQLERGRRCYARRAWADAYALLTQADEAMPLGAADLELLATSASMLGRDDVHLAVLERAHRAHLDAGEALAGARCAFWIGTHLAIRGETGRAAGWLGRAQRLVERERRDCVEQGYLLVPVMMQQDEAGDHEAAYATAVRAAGIGERFGEMDLVAWPRPAVRGRSRRGSPSLGWPSCGWPRGTPPPPPRSAGWWARPRSR